MIKMHKPKKAPKVKAPPRNKPNYMKESTPKLGRTSPMRPMINKKLSK